jgi:ATP-dependent DNA helicase
MASVHVDADLHAESGRASATFKDILKTSLSRHPRNASSIPSDPFALVPDHEDGKESLDDPSTVINSHSEFDQQMQDRLQRLLKRTDHIVNTVHNTMQTFIEKEKKNAAASSSVEVEENDEETSDADARENHMVDDEEGSPSTAGDSDPVSITSLQNQQQNGTNKFLRGRSLRNYQEAGVEWLSTLHQQGLNGILADEMGLGKTLTVLNFIASLWERHGIWGPHLVVVPMSVISSWKEELSYFLPGFFDVYIHHGNKEERRESFLIWRKAALAAKRAKQQAASMSSIGRGLNGGHGRLWPRGVPTFMVSLCFTTYDIALKDVSYLQKLGHGPLRWQYLVVDEAHRLKNRTGALFESLNKTHAARRLLLTGTPLQNNLSELWSLLSFVLPEIFNDIQDYAEWFNRPFELEIDNDEQTKTVTGGRKRKSTSIAKRGYNSHKNKPNQGKVLDALSEEERLLIVSSLHRIMKPFILRRLKGDVIEELPKKIERVIMCPQSALQCRVYDLIRQSVEDIEKAAPNGQALGSNSSTGASSTSTVYKPDAQTHSNLDGETAARSYRIFSTGATFNNVLMQLRKLCNHPYLVLEDMNTIPNELYYKNVVAASGKMCILERLLNELLPNGHKILIFSQMTTTLDIIQGYLQTRDIDCFRLDGNTSREDRESNISAFSSTLKSTKNNSSHNSSDTSTTTDDPVPSVYLLSTRAGGVGINLQAADTVIFFDSDWNPQADLQAMSRAHRLGQTKTVLVLRLVTPGEDKGVPSAEQRILKAAAHKLAAERIILADGEFDMGTATQNKRGRKSAAHKQEEEVVPVLSAEAGVLSLFASESASTATGNGTLSESGAISSPLHMDDSTQSDHPSKQESVIIETAIAAAATTAIAIAHASARVEGTASLSSTYIRAICNRNDDSITIASEIDQDKGKNNNDTNTTVEETIPLSMNDFTCALDWRDWLGMPAGFERQWSHELKRLKQENRERLAKLHDEERIEREKREEEKRRAAEEELEKQMKEREELNIKKKKGSISKKTRKSSKVVSPVTIKDIDSTISSPNVASAGPSPTRSSPRVRPGGRLVHNEDGLWDAAMKEAEAQAVSNVASTKPTSTNNSGEKRRPGRPSKSSSDNAQAEPHQTCVLCRSARAPVKRRVGRPPKEQLNKPTASVFDLPISDDEQASASSDQNIETEHVMLICDSCDKAFHLLCVGMTKTNQIPNGDWMCLYCQYNRDTTAAAATSLEQTV